MNFFEKLLSVFSQTLGGIGITVEIFVLTLVFSLPLGLLVAFGRMSKFKPLAWLARVYISILRGTPLMLQLFVIYFGPFYLLGISVTPSYRFAAVIIAFAINYAAYFAEIYRSGIAAVPVGQREAAHVLGYSKGKAFFRVVLPQVVKIILPSITNEVITLVKDTSLAFAIAVAEVFTLSKRIAARDTSMVPFVAVGIFYYLFNLLVAFLMERAEKRLSYYW